MLTVGVFLANLAATLLMTGAIWIVQAVHYPLFAAVGAEGFVRYEAEHQRRITWFVAPVMLVEMASGIAMVAGWRPEAVPAWAAIAGLALIGFLWISTAAVQVPLHTRLSGGFDAAAHRALVRTNWWRTAAWSLRAALGLWLAERVLAA
jgi:hypothetical protein